MTSTLARHWAAARRLACVLALGGTGLLAGCGGVADAIAEEILISKSRTFALSTSNASCSTDPGVACPDIELYATIQHQGPRETRPDWFEYPADGKGKVVDHLYRNQQADGRWALSLGFSPNLPPGVYTGRVEVTLTALFTEYVPAVLNYRLEVKAEQGNLSLLQAVPGAGDWSGPGGTTARDSRVALLVEPTRITRRWTRMLDSLDTTVQPALAEGRVLLPALRLRGETGNATVLNELDGGKAWSGTLPGVAVGVHPGGTQAFWITNTAGSAVTSRHTVTALSVLDGTSRWQQDLPGATRPFGLARAAGLLLQPAAGERSQLAARSEVDGQLRWSQGMGELTDAFDYFGWGVTVDAAAGLAYVNNGGLLSGVRLADGSRAMRITVPARGGSVLTRYGMYQAPVQADAQTLLLLTHRSELPEVTPDNQLSAVDLASGTVRWTVAGKFVTLPAVSGSTLYVANLANKQLEARSLADGSVLWNWPMEAGNHWQAQLVLTQGHLFLSTDQQTVAIDLATRQPAWRHARGGWLGLSSNGVLYLLARDAVTGSSASLTAFNLR